MEERSTLIEADGLQRFFGPTQAVQDFSFQLERGEILGFLGVNGAGKTTTMEMLTGNLAPSGGRIELNGCDLLDNPRPAKASVGYLPETLPLYTTMTVDAYLRFCARLNRVPKADLDEAVATAMRRCGLEDVAERVIANLSRGYKQRVGLAQAIVHDPEVLILDEPTKGLDPIQVREIRQLIRELGKSHSVILSSHVLPEVEAICTRVQIIHEGRLVLAEDVSALRARMQHSSLLLGGRALPAPESVQGIQGVERVERLDDGRLRVFHDTQSDTAEQIVARAASEGWGLWELTPERKSLEQVFVDLTGASESEVQDTNEEMAA
ncbi:ABC transporter ATP-binding protein [Rhodovibrio sodomensis]|uniref:ABC transporter ATP-binding protein n=1 Tax=Rhodovibrio sodomensis TaxID=1088 RepID=A0ABS1D9L6_9PROT|nr:ATP-binding cassette domain-containing protein [Rhodovibrio sodomensis]MBK1667092.1 ABC transporter ATP-binding protein [Rhodovibrio sodomensis]